MSDINWDDTDYLFALHNKKCDAIEFFEFKPSTTNCNECWMVSDSETLYLKEAWVLLERPMFVNCTATNSDSGGIRVTDKPEPKPIYTQAMSDAGELPSVGMECLLKMIGAYLPVTIKYNSEHVIVFTYKTDNGVVETCKQKNLNNIDIKPIDQRTDSEKAIDDLENSLFEDCDFGTDKGTAKFIVDAIKAGKIHGVTFTGEE